MSMTAAAKEIREIRGILMLVNSFQAHQKRFRHAGIDMAFFQRQTGNNEVIIMRQANDAAMNNHDVGALLLHVGGYV